MSSRIVYLDNYAEIVIDSKRYGTIISKIDIEDAKKLEDKTFFVSNEGSKSNILYVLFYLKDRSNKRQRLHRYLVNCPLDCVVDHKNFDTLDNRKGNLQIVTMRYNCSKKDRNNTFSNTGIRNITKLKEGSYEVCFYKDGKRIYRKVFKNLSDAIIAKKDFLDEKRCNF